MSFTIQFFSGTSMYPQTKQLLRRLYTPMSPPQTGTLLSALGSSNFTTTITFLNLDQAGQLKYINQITYPSNLQSVFQEAYTLAFKQDMSKGPSSDLRLAMSSLNALITDLH